MKYVWISLSMMIFACNNSDEITGESIQNNSENKKEESIDTLISNNEKIEENLSDSALLLATSEKIIHEFKKEAFSFNNINEFISSEGLQFSPYGYHNTENVILPKDSLGYYWSSNEKINWGSFDGSGEEINLTLKEYFEKFIWDMDFSQADTVLYESTKGLGNTIDNLQDYMPNAKYVEYYIDGKNPDYGGMDWGLLRLIYAKDNDGEYKLVAISHGQWTV